MEKSATFFEILTSDTYDLKRTQEWMKEIWLPISIKVTVVYLLFVFGGRFVMRNRKAFEMDRPLAIWNLVLTLFSFCGTVKLLPELIWTVRDLGLAVSYCDTAEFFTDPQTGYWAWLGTISKAPELFDTVFLVLRKRPVTFLQWYHHAVTFLFTQFAYTEMMGFSRWTVINLPVHIFMYSYFFLCSIKAHPPPIFAMFVTTIQLIQFVIGALAAIHLLCLLAVDSVPNCEVNKGMLTVGVAITLTYLYLFVQLFHKRYIVKEIPTQMASKSEKEA